MIEANAVRSRVFIDRNFNSTDCKGSRRQLVRLLAPMPNPKRVGRGA